MHYATPCKHGASNPNSLNSPALPDKIHSESSFVVQVPAYGLDAPTQRERAITCSGDFSYEPNGRSPIISGADAPRTTCILTGEPKISVPQKCPWDVGAHTPAP